MRSILTLAVLASVGSCLPMAASAQNTEQRETILKNDDNKSTFMSRLHVGGYGEAVFTRNFYSDRYLRYTDPESAKNESHGRFDIPHFVIYLGYDFGHGWSMSSEIEFEHGGTESAVEIETEEAGEYESEIERGGEVALEQFWIQKVFNRALNLRVGMQVVPVGGTNAHHEPDQFFGVYRPEGENTIMPCTWHEVGVTLWGQAGNWKYQAMFLPGLDSERFGNSGWIHDGSASPFEFKIANSYAFAARVDNTSVPGLRMSLSGYVGNSFRNTLYNTSNDANKGIHGTVTIGSFDFAYKNNHVVARGYFDYGHLSDAARISKFNISMSKNSTSKRQAIASDAITAGVEAGYDIFSLMRSRTVANQRLYLFGRYDYYDSMYKTEGGIADLKWCKRQNVTVGLNWYPIKQVIVKGEYSNRLFDKPYNNEPSVSLGIAFSGWFL